MAAGSKPPAGGSDELGARGPGRGGDSRTLRDARGVVHRVVGHDHARGPGGPAQAHDLRHDLGVRVGALLG